MTLTVLKVSKYGVFSGLYFLAFEQNRERYSVPLRIQSNCEKKRTRKIFVFGHFSRSAVTSTLSIRNFEAEQTQFLFDTERTLLILPVFHFSRIK